MKFIFCNYTENIFLPRNPSKFSTSFFFIYHCDMWWNFFSLLQFHVSTKHNANIVKKLLELSKYLFDEASSIPIKPPFGMILIATSQLISFSLKKNFGKLVLLGFFTNKLIPWMFSKSVEVTLRFPISFLVYLRFP